MATCSGHASENPQLARPRKFDEAVVSDAAIQCFWAEGYEATSVRDLADEMGITGAPPFYPSSVPSTTRCRNNARSLRIFQTAGLIVRDHILMGPSADIDFPKAVEAGGER